MEKMGSLTQMEDDNVSKQATTVTFKDALLLDRQSSCPPGLTSERSEENLKTFHKSYTARAASPLIPSSETPAVRSATLGAPAMSKSMSMSSQVIKGNLSKQLHKTRLCPYFSQGMCRNGDRCNYAHDANELIVPPDLSKTKLCEQFQAGSCNKENCRFAHSRTELRATEVIYKTRICHFWAAGHCTKGKLCRHAHGVEELRTESKVDLGQGYQSSSPTSQASEQFETQGSTTLWNVEGASSGKLQQQSKLEAKAPRSFGRAATLPSAQPHKHSGKPAGRAAARDAIDAAALHLLDRALSALNLKGGIALQAANFQLLMAEAVAERARDETSGNDYTESAIRDVNDEKFSDITLISSPQSSWEAPERNAARAKTDHRLLEFPWRKEAPDAASSMDDLNLLTQNENRLLSACRPCLSEGLAFEFFQLGEKLGDTQSASFDVFGKAEEHRPRSVEWDKRRGSWDKDPPSTEDLKRLRHLNQSNSTGMLESIIQQLLTEQQK